jgi:hypothetical protein
MRRRILISICLIPLATFCSKAEKPDAAVQHAHVLEELFAREIGRNATKSEVVRFLRQHAISYHDDERKHVIYASVPLKQVGLVKSGVYLQFQFDVRGVLLSHSFRAVYTGP